MVQPLPKDEPASTRRAMDSSCRGVHRSWPVPSPVASARRRPVDRNSSRSLTPIRIFLLLHGCHAGPLACRAAPAFHSPDPPMPQPTPVFRSCGPALLALAIAAALAAPVHADDTNRSEEHTSELQSHV